MSFSKLLENGDPPILGLQVILRAALEAASLLWYLTEPAIPAVERAERFLTQIVKQQVNGRQLVLTLESAPAETTPDLWIEEFAGRCEAWGLFVFRNKHGVPDRIGHKAPPDIGKRVASFLRGAGLTDPALIYPYLCATVHCDIGGLVDFLEMTPNEDGSGLIPYPRIETAHVETLATLLGFAVIVSFDRVVSYVGLDRVAWCSFATRCAQRLGVGYVPTLTGPS